MSRICDVCGKVVKEGMTDECYSFYCHEDCFEKYMDDRFGKHCWMKLGKGAEDGYGGYYLAAEDNNKAGFDGTGIYYTEWKEDDM